MGFNPLKRVREKRYPTSMQAELAERLRKLAELPLAPETPYLTVSLDWRPSGEDPEYRGAVQRFENDSRAIQREYWPRGPIFDSLGEDIERIKTWLDEEVDPATQGIFIVANSGIGVFATSALGLPLETRIVSGPIPALLPLARLDEDNPTYAVLIVNQQESYLRLISQGQRTDRLLMDSSDYPRKQASGGWSQRRFQARADERMMALGREINDEVQQYLEDNGVDMLIIAGDEVMTSVLDRTMSDELREYVVDTIRMESTASADEVVDLTLPIAKQAEAEREMVSVQTVSDAAGGGEMAVAGSGPVLEALAQGRVSHLVINEDFHESGWADFENLRYGTGESGEMFTGSVDGFEAVPVVLQEEMVRLAISTSAEIDVIHTGVSVDYDDPDTDIPDAGSRPRSDAAQKLDELGGVAALLRY